MTLKVENRIKNLVLTKHFSLIITIMEEINSIPLKTLDLLRKVK